MIAAFVVRTINPYGKGHDVLFYIEYFPEWSFYELIPFVILGLLGVSLKLNFTNLKKKKN